MDRHTDFAIQLARLVALYSSDELDRAAEKAALRAARGAAKHGAIVLKLEDGALLAGTHPVDAAIEGIVEMSAALHTVAVRSVMLAHHVKQIEIKGLADLLARVKRGAVTQESWASAVDDLRWHEITIERTAAVVDEAGGAPAATAAPESTSAAAPEAGPSEVEPALPVAGDAAVEIAPPLATELPASAAALERASDRDVFERIISASEPLNLRRFLDPVQTIVELASRDGRWADSLALLIATLDCEELATDPEMRRQFVVLLRRLTKPTLLRAIATLHAEQPDQAAAVERVLLRFGDDGAEALVDRWAGAPDQATRARYFDVLARHPAAGEAVTEMLDDDSPSVVERASILAARLRPPGAERALGELLGNSSVRIRRAAATALGAFTDSAFAVDALARALGDASADVRYVAAVGAQSRRDARLGTALVERFDVEAELDVQLALITALGKHGSSECVQKLIAVAMPDQRLQRKRDIGVLRLAAMEALGDARTPQAMVTLQKLLEDREKDVRETAARLYTRARRQTTATAGIAVVSEP